MGCRGCGKEKTKNQVRRADHCAMEHLRKLTDGGAWIFNGTVLERVSGRGNPIQEEYGDPAEAVIYWARAQELERR